MIGHSLSTSSQWGFYPLWMGLCTLRRAFKDQAIFTSTSALFYTGGFSYVCFLSAYAQPYAQPGLCVLGVSLVSATNVWKFSQKYVCPNHGATSGHPPYCWWRSWLPLTTSLSVIVAHDPKLAEPLLTMAVQLLTPIACPAVINFSQQGSSRDKMYSLSKNITNSHCSNPKFSSF